MIHNYMLMIIILVKLLMSEKINSMDSTIALLNDFTSRPFTMEYLQSIFGELSSRSSDIKEKIRRI